MKDDVPPNVVQEIRDALTIPNEARRQAQREHVWDWRNMPETIKLYQEDRHAMWLPRGFAETLFGGLEERGVAYEIVDRRERVELPVHTALALGLKRIPLREYQRAIVERMLAVEQGVLEAPPGSGKTVASLELIKRAGQKSLVIVDKVNIAMQWINRCEQFLGYVPGLIGDGEFQERDISVALVQTLWRKQDELVADHFFERWGLVLLDECHHVPARTFTDTMGRFPAYYRFGVSATPERREGQWLLVESTLGELAYRLTKADLRQDGVLVSPRVYVHQTGFSGTYFSTHKFVRSDVCERMGCTRPHHRRVHRNNYSDIVSRLAEDPERNKLIATEVTKDLLDGRHCLILSSRKSQLRAIHDIVDRMLGYQFKDLYMLTGEQSGDKRMKIAEAAELGSCAIFSTIADEALDIPRLDSLHLAWPTRNVSKIRQQLGRIERTHPFKKDAVVHDYADDVGPLRGQLADRFEKVYVKEGLQLEVPEWLKKI